MITPCISLCRLVDGKCVGCKRTTQEIVQWSSYTDNQRERLMEELKEREHETKTWRVR